MESKPIWWDRYFTPWSDECNSCYEKYKNEITFQEKSMDWDKGEREVIYKVGSKIVGQFKEKF